MSSIVAKKRKRLSKNKKKNWRKTDIKDVEDHLEDVRLQERTGGLVSEKTDEQLFFVDKTEPESEVPVKRRKKEVKPLKCHALLEPDPNIKAFKVSHNVPKVENLVKRKSARVRDAEPKATKAQVQANKQREQSRLISKARRSKRNILPTADRDLWGESLSASKPSEDGHDAYFLKYTKKTRVQTPKHHLEKPSAVSAIEAPHPGQSYNPTFSDHQDLLKSALSVEVKKLKQEKRLHRALDEKFPSVAQAPNQASWLAEMSSGLGDGDLDDGEVTYTEEELGRVSVNPPVRRDAKKTEKQRRKERELKEKEKRAKKEKLAKARKNQLTSQLKSVKKEVRQREADLKQRAATKQQRKLETKDLPKRLGKLKYEAPNIEIKLSDELVGSLRELKPEGHLLEDRFRSMQKRNIIEPRNRAKFERKLKVKWAEKKGHKEITI